MLASHPGGSDDSGQQYGNYTTDDGDSFQFLCNYDHYGGDIATEASNTFEGCFSICANYDGCDGFSFHSADNACYLKNEPFNQSNTNPESDFAQIITSVQPSTTTTSSSSDGSGLSKAGLILAIVAPLLTVIITLIVSICKYGYWWRGRRHGKGDRRNSGELPQHGKTYLVSQTGVQNNNWS